MPLPLPTAMNNPAAGSALRHYAIVTAAYWGFTLTDGALRMLVLLHFHGLGFNSLEIAFLFLFYEFFGIVTNLTGGWLGARFGLRLTLWSGLLLQVLALLMLLPVSGDWPRLLSITYVMLAQALSGIAKDLTKMSSKSAIRTVLPDDDASDSSRLFRWVAILTGSKNALKGVGFFLGAVLLQLFGFGGAVASMAAALALVFCGTLDLPRQLGRMKRKPPFTAMWSTSSAINRISAARFFLFGARDVWFVVALPVFLETDLGWTYSEVGAFLALWVIGYGLVQSATPSLRRLWGDGLAPGARASLFWTRLLSCIPLFIVIGLVAGRHSGPTLMLGLGGFGLVLAINSSIHSYLVLAYSDHETVSLDVGFYYMANAAGRLLGTLLSGLLFLWGGLISCLIASFAMVVTSSLISRVLPEPRHRSDPAAGTA